MRMKNARDARSGAHAYNPRTWEAEAGGFRVQSQPEPDPISKIKNKKHFEIFHLN
jgi:hypothetical protein